MSEMVEKVARAIEEAPFEFGRTNADLYRAMARVAIAATESAALGRIATLEAALRADIATMEVAVMRLNDYGKSARELRIAIKESRAALAGGAAGGIERLRAALDGADDLLMSAAENLRSADKDERRVDAAFRIASKLDALRTALAGGAAGGEEAADNLGKSATLWGWPHG